MEIAREILHKGLVQLAIDLQYEAVLWEYLLLLKHWNRAFNLVSNADEIVLARRHLLDSLSVRSHIIPGKCLDIGTGAGLPGIPLAVTMPQTEWVLLDSNGKKTRFCTQVVHELGLENVQVVKERVEKYFPDFLFNSIISRAFSSTSKFVEMSKHLVAKQGIQLAMKGQISDLESEDALGTNMNMKIHHLNVPGLNEQRHVIIFKAPES